ncbi:hypothetical protein M6B38_290915 [Iris pallida]|uniref:Uncharacterized protein n=1 Tax=Iris pallida TaxID=29817 RepID=A0AAX6HVA3_IRIPA|nr:hypothetical protein M6B38_290915 [Iris pallida]
MTRRARPRRRGAGRAAASARRPDRRRGEGSADLNLVTPIDGGRLHSSAVVVSISSMTVSTRMGCDMAPRLQAMSIISGRMAAEVENAAIGCSDEVASNLEVLRCSCGRRTQRDSSGVDEVEA